MAFQNACRVSKIFNSPVRTRTNANLIKLFAFKLCNWHDVIDSMRFSNQRNDSIGVYVNLLSIHSVLIRVQRFEIFTSAIARKNAFTFSSAAQRPTLAPASMAMLESVARDSTLIASTVSPQNSSALYVAPSAVIRDTSSKNMSFE